MGYKAYSDSYLMSLTKAQIIELLRVAEHNFFATEEALNNSAKAGMEIAEKYDKAKRLLKVAVEDFSVMEGSINNMNSMFNHSCSISNGCQECPMSGVDEYGRCKWRYSDEAKKFIKG